MGEPHRRNAVIPTSRLPFDAEHMTNELIRRCSGRTSTFSRALRYATLLTVLLALAGPSASAAFATTASSGNAVYVGPLGADSNACSQIARCLTIDRAYKALAPGGGSILLASGSYGRQSVSRIAAKANDTVRTQVMPEPGATVTVAGLALSADHIAVSNLTTSGYNVYGVDVQLLNVKSTAAIYITGATDVSVVGGEVSAPTPVTSDSMISSRYGVAATNVVIDHVWFHDFIDVDPGNLHHIECLQVGSGENLTIRNSRFGPNCDTHDLFIRSWGNNVNNSPHPLNLHIENNLFEPCDKGCYAFMAIDDLYTLSPTSLVLSGNTFEPGTAWSFNWSHGTASAYGNLLPTTSAFVCGYLPIAGALRPSSIFHDNLWYGPAQGCGTNALTVPTTTGLWTGNGDYHLAAGSPAIDRLPVDSSSDIDGDARPQGSRFDAGADERTAQVTPPPTITTTTTTTTTPTTTTPTTTTTTTATTPGTQATPPPLFGITGASRGTCSTSPCTTGITPCDNAALCGSIRHIVGLGQISNGIRTETRRYGWYKPANLAGTPAAVFVAGGAGCGSSEIAGGRTSTLDGSGWKAVADVNKLAVVVLAKPPCSERPAGWLHKQIDCDASGCNLGSNPGDEAYVAAAVADATARLGLDPARRYLTGASTGGALTRDIFCDRVRGSLFRGYAIISNGVNSALGGSTGACPAGHTNTFLQFVEGTLDTYSPYTSLNLPVASPTHTALGFHQSRAWLARYLGCNATPVGANPDLFGTSSLNKSYKYNCPFGLSDPQFEAVLITNGGHTWGGLDGINGFSTAKYNWAFFAATKT
jgi:poly(3-hydroxybutyrate) depolymerase